LTVTTGYVSYLKMLKFLRLPLQQARRAWPRRPDDSDSVVPIRSSIRDIRRAGIDAGPVDSLPHKREVLCLFDPAEQKIIFDKGVHVEATAKEIPDALPSPFPGHVKIAGVGLSR